MAMTIASVADEIEFALPYALHQPFRGLLASAVAAERERCAKIAETYFDRAEDRACGDLIAEQIRKGE